jgi:hypothetical protein
MMSSGRSTLLAICWLARVLGSGGCATGRTPKDQLLKRAGHDRDDDE